MTDHLLTKLRIRRNYGHRLLHAVLLLCLACAPLNAQETEGDEASPHILAAELALEKHEYKVAAIEFRKAAELSPSVSIAKQATRVAYSFGFTEDALLSARRWAELDRDSDEALLYVAQLELRLGKIGDAKRSFRKLLDRGDEPADETLLSFIPFLAQEDEDDAYKLMRELAKPYPNSAAAHYALAVLALQAEDAEKAGEEAIKASDIDPDWIKPRLLYARSLLLSGDVDAAIVYVAKLVGDNAHPDPEARLELAIMYLSAGRDDDALSQVNQILLEQPSRSDALRLMAIINFRLGNLDVAQDDFEDLLGIGRYTMDALYYLARIADRRGETSRAIAFYSQVIKGPNAVSSQRRASGLIATQGDPEAAMEHLQKFGEAHPNHAVAMVRAQAQLLASQGEYEEALKIYDRVVSYRPDDENIVLGRAELLVRMGRIDEAIASYRLALKRFPKSASALNALGYTLADHTDKYSEASRLIKKAIKIAPESPAIIDSYGWVLYKQGKYERALDQLESAYSLLRDPEVAAHIVETLLKLERNDEALKILEEAELESPDHSLLKSIREREFSSNSG
jgi:tetratricopeptide (TPR) repeat protein